MSALGWCSHPTRANDVFLLLSRYLEDICPLASLPSLRALVLEGNPVARAPNYRAQLVHHLNALETLDKKTVVVTAASAATSVAPSKSIGDERQAAAEAVSCEAPLQRALFEQALSLCLLDHLRAALPLHAEIHLVAALHRRRRQARLGYHYCGDDGDDGGGDMYSASRPPPPMSLILRAWKPLARRFEEDAMMAQRLFRRTQVCR